jgi:hypothetical protein
MMAESEIVFVEGEHIIKNLSVLNKHMDSILGRVVDPPLKKFMRSFMQQELKPYPPKPPQSTYVRTKELYRSWDISSDRRLAEVKITNTVDYANWVVGEGQVWWHDVTGWPFLPDEGIIARRKAVPVVEKALDSEIRRFLFKRSLI